MRFWLSCWGRAFNLGRLRRQVRQRRLTRRTQARQVQVLEKRDLPSFPAGVLPVLNSLPGASATLYLDFDDNTEAFWGTETTGFFDVDTPNFDIDGMVNDLGTVEFDGILEIWRRVAEDFAPFNINVTTVDPLDFSNQRGLRVSIGGTGDWFGTANGAAQMGGFANELSNTVFVFSETIGPSFQDIAEEISHQAGYAFGLQNQSQYNAMGGKVAELNPGNAVFAPIMGNSYGKARTTWFNGANTVSADTLQDDMAIIAGAENGFGFRQDDIGDTFANGRLMQIGGGIIEGAGIINSTTDVDVFRFSTNATNNDPGNRILVTPNVIGANLSAVVELRTAAGQLVTSANAGVGAGGVGLAAVLNARNLAAGEYQIIVRSNGTYGSVGQYTILGNGLVAGIAPQITLNPPARTIPESTNTTNAVEVAQIVMNNPDGGPENLTLTGADANSFEISQNRLRLRAGVVLDFEGKTTYNVRVNVDDPYIGGPVDSFANFVLTISDINDAPIVTDIPAAQFYIASTPPLLLGAGANLSDQDTAVLNGGTITVRHTAATLATDRLEIRNQGTGNGLVTVNVTNTTTNTGTLSFTENINGVTATRLIGTFTGGIGSTPLVITLNANATLNAAQRVLRNLTFVNPTTNPDNGGQLLTRQVRIEVADGEGATSAPVNQTITINRKPTITGITGSVNYTELSPPVIVGTNGVLTDTNPSYNGAQLTARVSSNSRPDDKLSLSTQGTAVGQIQVIYDVGGNNTGRINYTRLVNNLPSTVQIATFGGGIGAGALTVTFNANANLASMQQVLRNINYSNTGNNPTNFGNALTRQIEFRFNDAQQGISDPIFKTVNVIAINSLPVIANLPASTLYAQNGGAVLISPAATVTDTDSPNFSGGVLDLTHVGSTDASDLLEIRDEGTASGQISVVPATGTTGKVFYTVLVNNQLVSQEIGSYTGGDGANSLKVTLNGNATLAAVQQLLRNITYRSLSENPEADGAKSSRQIRYTVSDGDGGTSAGVITTVQMNRAPVISEYPATGTYTEGGATLFLGSRAVVTDTTSANFDGGVLEVLHLGSFNGNDRFEIQSESGGFVDLVYVFVDDAAINAGRIFVDRVTPGGIVTQQLGEFTGGIGGTPLAITFNANATAALVQRVLRRITYRAVGDNPTNFGTQQERLIRVSLTDGDAFVPSIIDTSINVIGANDAPTLGGVPAAQSYTENAGAQLVAPTATISDPDSANFDGGFIQTRFVGTTQADDRIEIRHQGTQNGQISVNVTKPAFNLGTVSYTSIVNGVLATRQIGIFNGGLGATQLLIALNANADAEAVQALLRALTYRNAGDNPTSNGTSTSRQLRTTVFDGDGGVSNTAAQQISLIPVNDAAVIGNLDTSPTYSSLGPPKFLAASGTITDADSLDFGNGALAVRYWGAFLATDRLEIQNEGTGNGQIKVVVTNAATYSGTIWLSTVVGGVTSTVQIGTFSGGIGGEQLVILLNNQATTAATQRIMRRITYRNTAANPSNSGALPTRRIGFRLNDGDGTTSADVIQTLNVQ